MGAAKDAPKEAAAVRAASKYDHDHEKGLDIAGAGSSTSVGASIPVCAFLLVTATACPSMLGEPYAFAVLSWAPAIVLNLLMTLASLYCMYNLACLHHYKGYRLSTYRAIGEAVLGPRYGPWLEGIQFGINLGTIIANTILGGKIMQCVYNLLCTDPTACTFHSLARWTAITGAVSWLLVISTRQLAHAGLISTLATVGFAFYALSAIGMAAAAVADKGAPPRDYSPVGDTALAKTLHAFNAIGMLMFLYGITVLPEIQAVLAEDPRTGETTRPMVYAALIAHAGFVPIFLTVGALGYYAYGSAVNPFLLLSTRHPVWLVAAASLVGVVQLQITSLVYALPMFARLESNVLIKNPGKRWMRPRGSGGPDAAAAAAAAAAATAPSPPESPRGRLPPIRRRVSSVIAAAGNLPITRRVSSVLAAGALPIQRGVSSVISAVGSLPPIAHDFSYPARSSMIGHRPSLAELGRLPSPGLAASLAPAASAGLDARIPEEKIDEWAEGDGDEGEGDDEVPSWALQFLHRTAWAALWTLVAVAFPFFESVMGLVGALGLGPFTYCLPTLLYMRAFPMRPLVKAANIAFVAFWLTVSAAAAVGGAFGIVEASKENKFFVS